MKSVKNYLSGCESSHPSFLSFSFEMQHNFLGDWQIFRSDVQENEQLEKEYIFLTQRINIRINKHTC